MFFRLNLERFNLLLYCRENTFQLTYLAHFERPTPNSLQTFEIIVQKYTLLDETNYRVLGLRIYNWFIQYC